MSMIAKLATLAAAMTLSLALAAPAQAFGGMPVVPQAIERHLEQQRLQEQIERREREREAAEAAHKDAAPAPQMPEAAAVRTAKPTATRVSKTAKAAKGNKKAPQPALAHSAQVGR